MSNARILVFVPMYQCREQVVRVLARLDARYAGLIAEIAVIDNGSRDGGREAAAAALAQLNIPARLWANRANYHLGGSHKVAFDLALREGFTHVLVLHGDDQADPDDLLPHLRSATAQGWDCFLGSRFSLGSRRQGYSRLRTFGNFFYNGLFCLATRRWLVDLGSGLNLFRLGWLRDRGYHLLADDLTFNYFLVLLMCARRARFRFFPISWREEDQVSNVRLVRQAAKTLGMLASWCSAGPRWLRRPHGRFPPGSYRADVLFANAAFLARR
jgi:dolichol-phosphate mannosyltransferase